MIIQAESKHLVAALAVCLPLLGCGQQADSVDFDSVLEHAESPTADETQPVTLVAGAEAVERTVSNRKIIYTADVELVVDDFAVFERQISGVISSHGGYAAERSSDRRHGDHRGGTWVIRVPVANYDAFLSGLDSIGFARSRSETSDDVTEAYVDLEARISNKQKLEERILAMLEQRPGKLTDLMEIERELSRVREEIERMEGRMRVLKDQTSLATVTLRVVEEATYQPPAAPTFSDRIAAAWGGSIRSIGQIATGLVIVAVAVIPWAVMLVPIALLAYRFRLKIAQ
ncbi:DUF4349 domain-containing protein [Stieleria sp. ICT_E10.1]|uniref:DUF4349 domain-containing protein n=1 Tax=Stieleria sedimenti TaxID=2976331 RepID=UPI002180856F|nr:DUF4349 domain-containing protein [Stieleria sedimenti]MCS7468924.1 DUF4349 domain-containing protein [Stieleria sedimenti]